MKLLITTQAVDSEDPVLGFFVRWIEEFAKHYERVEVICLKEGTYALPANVRVYSLGKPASRLRYIFNFSKYIFSLDYDAVFVHMNQEYVILGGFFWKLMGKRVVLWRNHKMGSLFTRLAVAFSNTVCYTSLDAFVARYKNTVLMPIGIDTDFFTPPISPAPQNSILFLGRLDPVKKVQEFIEALTDVSIPFHADLYGSPTQPDSSYAKKIAVQARPLADKKVLALHSGIPHENTRELYQSHAIYVNLTPSGSFDKTIGEAMASGCIVVSSNRALHDVINPSLMVRDNDAQDVARGIRTALTLSTEEWITEARKLRMYIVTEHSLSLLANTLTHIL